MYIAKYNDDTIRIVQVVVRLPTLVLEPADARPSWWAEFEDAVSDLIAPLGVDFAFRLSLQNQRLERVLLLSTTPQRQDQLTALVRVLDGLNGVVKESVEVCRSREEHDQITSSIPPVRKWMANEPFLYQRCQLFHGFRVFKLVAQLLSICMERNWNITFQANVRRYRPTSEDLRWARKNLLCIESNQSIPSSTVELQRQVVEKLNTAEFVMDEFVAFDDGLAAERLGEVIDYLFRSACERLGFSGTLLETDQSDWITEQLLTGLHSSFFSDMHPAAVTLQALRADRLQNIVAWKPELRCVLPLPKNVRGADARTQWEYLLEYLRDNRGRQTVITVNQNIGSVQGGRVEGVRVGSIGSAG